MLSSLCKPIISKIKHNIRLMAKVHEIENNTLSDSAYLKTNSNPFYLHSKIVYRSVSSFIGPYVDE